MKRFKIVFSVISICLIFSGCVSDADYEALEERVTRLEETIENQQQLSTADSSPDDSINQDNTEDESIVDNQEIHDPYAYSISDYSGQQVYDEVMKILNNPPYQNEPYEEYEKIFPVAPIYIENDNFNLLRYYFYDLQSVVETPKSDVIYYVSLDGTCTELDGTIGIDGLYGAKAVEVEVKLFITDYDKATEVYNLLFDRIAPNYNNVSNTTEGSIWSGQGSITLSENTGYGGAFISMYRDDVSGGYALTVKQVTLF